MTLSIPEKPLMHPVNAKLVIVGRVVPNGFVSSRISTSSSASSLSEIVIVLESITSVT